MCLSLQMQNSHDWPVRSWYCVAEQSVHAVEVCDVDVWYFPEEQAVHARWDEMVGAADWYVPAPPVG